MKEPGAILLVACYELGHQPLAVAWPAAFLEQHGYAPEVMDVSVAPFEPGQAARARLVAISVPMHTALRLGVGIAERVREVNPDCHVCFYGLYAELNADWLLATCADSVLAGELESELVELAARLERGERVRGVRSARLAKLAFPLPRRNALPALDKYARLERDGRLELTGYVEGSRGCKHECRHCPIPPVYGGRFFVVPRDVVLADVRQLVAAGARHITFGDPDFLNGPGHAMALARALHAEFPEVTFDVTAKVEHLLRHRRLLPELAALGCAFVVSAVESLSDTVLGHLAKGHTRADFVEVLGLARAAGLTLRPTWVAFTPWTTLDDYREMLDFIARERLVDHVDPVQYSIRLLVPPGSLLLEHEGMRPHLGALIQDAFHYHWTHPDPRMDRLHAEVSAAVATGADAKQDAHVTFARIVELADVAAGNTSDALVTAEAPPNRSRPPRLTEPWFC
ncbi:MAG TPA: CUAEP/CCAEP-tail radical SAM protein [Candidatus Acidoferrum sp.]|nr:CUAEP/CCAEP-tail radical SAM protein [Candidatus Acidoferrum sp.]